MKKSISLIITFVLLFSILVVGSPVNAAQSDKKELNPDEITIYDLNLEPGEANLDEIPDKLRKKLEKRIKEIDKYFEDLGDAKVELDILKEKKQKEVGIFSEEDETKLKEAKEKYEYLAKNSYEIVGLIKLEEDEEKGTIDILSTEFDVTTDKPSVYWDSDSQMYVMSGSWRWNKTYPDSTVGGPDGFGLRNQHEMITVIESGLRTYDENGTRYTHTNYSPEKTAWGVGMRFQDAMQAPAMPKTYNAYRGNGWAYFIFYNGIPYGKTVTFTATYAHSWSSTSLNGFSVGPYSFGLAWSTQSNCWDRPNNANIKF